MDPRDLTEADEFFGTAALKSYNTFVRPRPKQLAKVGITDRKREPPQPHLLLILCAMSSCCPLLSFRGTTRFFFVFLFLVTGRLVGAFVFAFSHTLFSCFR